MANNAQQLKQRIGQSRGYDVSIRPAGNPGGAVVKHSGRLFVEGLVAQNRNSILRIESSACGATACNLTPGQTAKFTLFSRSAPNGYEQTQAFLNFPSRYFTVLHATTRFSAPPNKDVAGVYGDGCGWNHSWWTTTPEGARECLDAPPPVAGGRIGGNLIRTTYTVKVRADAPLGTLAERLTGIIYDKSGSSYHYNADLESGSDGALGPKRKTIAIRSSADLRIAKSHGGTFTRGGTGTYSLAVTNDGPNGSATPITITDTLPAGAGVTFRASPDHATAGASGFVCTRESDLKVTCTRSTVLAKDATAGGLQLHVDVAANASAHFANTATVTQGDAAVDTDPSDNTVEDPTTTASPGQADLVVTNTAQGTFGRGDAGAYRIGVRNDGPSSVPGPVQLTYTLPTGVSYVGDDSAGNEWDCGAAGQTITCTRSTLAATTAASDILVNVAVADDAPDPLITSATAVSTGVNPPEDPYLTNNQNVEAVVSVGQADLVLQKSNPGAFQITPTGVTPALTGTFTLTVRNDGPDAAYASASRPITLTDTLPPELNLHQVTAPGWSCNSAAGVLTCLRTTPLAAGASSSVLVAMSVPSNAAEVAVLNSAKVSGTTADPDPDNNEALDVASLQHGTKLVVTKAGPAQVTAPGTIEYTITVDNQGPRTATNASFEDECPSARR